VTFSHTDAPKFTGLADTFARRVLWAETANRVADATGNQEQAVKLANSAVVKSVRDAMNARVNRQNAKASRFF